MIGDRTRFRDPLKRDFGEKGFLTNPFGPVRTRTVREDLASGRLTQGSRLGEERIVCVGCNE